MQAGFVHAGDDQIRWNPSDPEGLPEEQEDLFLQDRPEVKSFRLASSLRSKPLKARHCERCRVVVFAYGTDTESTGDCAGDEDSS